MTVTVTQTFDTPEEAANSLLWMRYGQQFVWDLADAYRTYCKHGGYEGLSPGEVADHMRQLFFTHLGANNLEID